MSARKDAQHDRHSGLSTLRAILVLTCRAADVHVPLLLSVAAAIWAVRAGPLPGTGALARYPIAGGTLVAALWVGAYLGLGYALLRRWPGLDVRARLRRLGVAMLLLVVACAPLAFVDSQAVGRLHYLKPLYWLAATLAVFGLAFRAEAAALWQDANARPRVAATRAVILSLAAAGAAVAGIDALLHVDGHWRATDQLGPAAFIVNSALLASIHLALFAILRRLPSAILLGTAVFSALGFANLGKMTYMHAAVQPLDLLYVAEFLPQLEATFGLRTTAALLASFAALLVGLVLAARRMRPSVVSWRARALLAGTGLAVLAGAVASESRAPLRRALDAVGVELAAWDSVRSARRNGVLLEFLALVPSAFVDMPAGYSAASIAGAARKYLRSERSADAEAERPADPTLIVYMIESLMDPNDLGVGFTSDPVPTLHALAARHPSGHAIVPGRFGESASSEFEVLTGMSTFFLPERSVAYKQYVKRMLPALPCELRERGYRTAAVQADPRSFYNRTEVYRHLCFDEIAWLDDDPSVPRAINDRAPTDEAVVDAVIEAASGPVPAFVFAFPSSTHHPYDLELYADSALDLADPESTSARAELKYYVNALRVADAAVKKLVDHFARVERPVLIAIVGDHLPPLSAAALEGFYARLGDDVPALERLAAERRVPLVVWSNFETTREDLVLSLNLLGPRLLERAGLEPAGFLGVVAEIGKQATTISRGLIGRASTRWPPDAAPGEYVELLEDYALLQYDVLFGERFLAAELRSDGAAKMRGAAAIAAGANAGTTSE